MEFNVVKKRETIPAVCRYFSQVKEIAIDTETNNELNPREGFLRLIQISDGIKTVVIDLKECFPLYWEGEDIKDEKEILLIKELLEHPKILKVLHNAVFDYEWLMYHLGIRMQNVADTMLASQIVDNLEKKHSLALVAKRKLDIDLDKTEQNTDWCGVLTAEKYEYAALDVYYLLKLWHIFFQDFLDFDLTKTGDLEFSIIEAMTDLKHDGIHANKELYEKKIHLIEELQVIANRKLQEALADEDKPIVVQQSLFGEIPEKVKGGVLVSSPTQIKRVLQNKGIPIIDKDWWEVKELYQNLATNSGKEKAKVEMQNCVDMVKRRYLRQGKYFADGTGSKALSPITEEWEILQLLKDSREADKMSTSYGREFLKHIQEVEGDTRIFASYRAIGAPTGRMACREPNIQNITNKPIMIGGEEFVIGLREAFDYPKGKKGVNADYSQIELRVLADMSGDPVMIDTFKKGKDLHSVAGAKHLRMDYDAFELIIKDEAHPEHKKCVKARYFAKRVNFGTVYGIGAKGLSVQLKCSEAEAQKWIDGFASTFKVAWDFLQKQANLAITNLVARTVLGRRQLFEKPEEKWQIGRIGRNGMNMPIQGTAADIMKRAFYLLHKALKPYDAKIVSIVHDEVTVECDENIAEMVAKLVERALIDAAEETLNHVPVKVDAHIIENWGKK